MLGSAMLCVLHDAGLDVIGAVRNDVAKQLFPPRLAARLFVGGGLEQDTTLDRLLKQTRPDWVINCASVARALHGDVDRMLGVYSLLPQRLAHLCRELGARLLQIGS